MITIKDIAREAGVSHGTVSNVLNKTGKVSVEKIKLVEDAIKKLGYIRNTQAQQLRQGIPKSIAIVLPNIQSSHYRDLYLTLHNKFTNNNYDVNLYITNDTIAIEKNIISQLNFSNLAAIISISCLKDTSTVYNCTCPIIFIDRKSNFANNLTSFISFDYSACGNDIGKYIIENNYTNVCYFTNYTRFSPQENISKELRNILNENNINLNYLYSDQTLINIKAFNILKSNKDYDIIITETIESAEALSSAFNFLNKYETPKILTLDSLNIFPNDRFIKYELNYKFMANIIFKALTNYLVDDIPLEKIIILKNDGFRFTFPNINFRNDNPKMNMLTLTSPSSSALQKLLPNFKKVTGIDLNLTTLSFQDLYEHISTVGDSSLFDLIRIDVSSLPKLAKKIYLPLNEIKKDFSELSQNLILEKSSDYLTVDNVEYSLPFDPSTLVFLYRKDLFEDAIIKRSYYEMYHENLTIPEDFNQYNRIAAFFTRSINPNSPILYGTTATAGTAAVASCDFLTRLFYSTDNIFDDNGNILINTDEVLHTLDNYVESYNLSSKKTNSWWGDSVKEFSDGLAAMAITFSNHASYIINSKHSKIVGKIGSAPLPGNKPLLGGGVIGIAKNSKKHDECYEFFKWFYSSEISTAFTMLGGLSPHKDIYKNDDIISLFPWISESKDGFSTGKRLLSNKLNPNFDQRKFENILGTAIIRVINGNCTTKEALEYVQELYK